MNVTEFGTRHLVLYKAYLIYFSAPVYKHCPIKT